ncbi:28S rRNA (cytosine-C(5))-methyltransferase-like [Paramacrobiotus metropolitanus]|uniref:28S rRNA (cytosine-C(5))-methyltransferase-like n=1 Tax=Paramacrobiotus metropolitanus TaxID=2943436 RepID=UPI00244596C3|nr:28S rRNA (cytosine-C(5))-methyltransferase-like [Paramacrobiotus metropolitanus]
MDSEAGEELESASSAKQKISSGVDVLESHVGNIERDLYAAAAECIDAVLGRRASVKSAIFNSPFQDKRLLLALTQKTIDHLPHVKKIVHDSRLLKLEPRITKSMAYVAAFDILFGNMKKRKGVGRLVAKHENVLKDILKAYLKERNINSIKEIKSTKTAMTLSTPRYVRVNTLKTTTEEVCKRLQEEGFELEEYDASISQHTFLKTIIRKLKKTVFFRDYHVPDMLVFHPTVIFHDHPLEKEGKVILQDKASCLASLLLNPPPGSTVIDACAAPGMKTSHLAALMKNEGKIFAVDIQEARCKIMKDLLKHYGVDCTEVINDDFLHINPESEDYSKASHILVDPTCTGSGTTSRIKQNKKKFRNTKEDRQRLQKLKGLQATLLKHALSFPNVQRVVYSTCSINPEEDEEVVQEALKPYAASFILRPFSRYLPKWRGCGKPKYAVGPNCLRAFTEKHKTNGFFVAVIERIKNWRRREYGSAGGGRF